MPLGLLVLVAIIQGITEFLPVSSSGHLVLLPLVSGYAYQGQTIDVAAHVGTLVAVLIYVRREVLAISIAWLGFGRRDPANGWLGLLLVVATIPVIIAGYLVNYATLDWLDLVQTLAVANLFFAGLLWFADRQPPRRAWQHASAPCCDHWDRTSLCPCTRHVTVRHHDDCGAFFGL